MRSPWTLRNEPAPYRNAAQRRDALVMILALATVAAVLILARFQGRAPCLLCPCLELSLGALRLQRCG